MLVSRARLPRLILLTGAVFCVYFASATAQVSLDPYPSKNNIAPVEKDAVPPQPPFPVPVANPSSVKDTAETMLPAPARRAGVPVSSHGPMPALPPLPPASTAAVRPRVQEPLVSTVTPELRKMIESGGGMVGAQITAVPEPEPIAVTPVPEISNPAPVQDMPSQPLPSPVYQRPSYKPYSSRSAAPKKPGLAPPPPPPSVMETVNKPVPKDTEAADAIAAGQDMTKPVPRERFIDRTQQEMEGRAPLARKRVIPAEAPPAEYYHPAGNDELSSMMPLPPGHAQARLAAAPLPRPPVAAAQPRPMPVPPPARTDYSKMPGIVVLRPGENGYVHSDAQAGEASFPVYVGDATPSASPASLPAFQAFQGEDLRQVLERWCAKDGTQLQWESWMSFPVKMDFSSSAKFEDVVGQLLGQYAGSGQRPLGALHTSGGGSPKTLVVSVN